MLPSILNDTSITFFARGRAWSLARDHANFGTVRDLLVAGSDDADRLIHLVDITLAVSDATGGAVVLTEHGIQASGEDLSQEWRNAAIANPSRLLVLTAKPGDKIRVEGDEDAPDGIYDVSATDTTDTLRFLCVDSEDGYFGFVLNSAVKEVIRA